MDRITSRKNPTIAHIRKLSSDREYRYFCKEYVCEGMTLLYEAIHAEAVISTIIWNSGADKPYIKGISQFEVPAEMLSYVSALKNSPGPVFTVKMPAERPEGKIDSAIVLENIQDPGNLGTVIRTASAFGIGSVVLTGDCADQYNVKAVRASMGAVFRQRIETIVPEKLRSFADSNSLHLCAAELSAEANDIRLVNCENCAFAIGNEGSGLSREIRDMCEKKVIIPMSPDSESLNAAVAASILMWEIRRREE